jgi:ABC-type transport system involved in cytochrome bd biosynthesis fused ATPase/permease subunit
MTIKDNIILDKQFDQKKFDFAIKYSALDNDLRLFDEGAMRMITDGASNLSGGQRTRVTLARALYQE